MSLIKKEMSKQRITLGLSMHRPEMGPSLADLMQRHDAIVPEEPPVEGFQQMLQGALAVDDYLRELDAEYPAFNRNMCYLLRRLQSEGKKSFKKSHF
jgi:hypothetical protein